MSFTEVIGSGFQNAFNFRGRAGVGEFWKWILFYTLVNIVFEIVVVSEWGETQPLIRLLDDLILPLS